MTDLEAPIKMTNVNEFNMLVDVLCEVLDDVKIVLPDGRTISGNHYKAIQMAKIIGDPSLLNDMNTNKLK